MFRSDGNVGPISGVVTEKNEPCRYLCTSGGGCQVRYAGPAQDGSTLGNCFSEAFGGTCSGTPKGCRDCNKLIECGDTEDLTGRLGGPPPPG